MQSAFAAVLSTIILLPTCGICYLAWRIGRALKVVEPRSLCLPSATLLAFIPFFWFVYATVADMLYSESSRVAIGFSVLFVVAPVLALFLVIQFLAPVTLLSNIPLVAKHLRGATPGTARNVVSSIGLVCLAATGIAFGWPYYQTLEIGKTARSPNTPHGELIRLSQQASQERDAGLAHRIMQNPIIDNRMYAALTADCVAHPKAEGCAEYLSRLLRRSEMPEELVQKIEELYGPQSLR